MAIVWPQYGCISSYIIINIGVETPFMVYIDIGFLSIASVLQMISWASMKKMMLLLPTPPPLQIYEPFYQQSKRKLNPKLTAIVA